MDTAGLPRLLARSTTSALWRVTATTTVLSVSNFLRTSVVGVTTMGFASPYGERRETAARMIVPAFVKTQTAITRLMRAARVIKGTVVILAREREIAHRA